MATTLDPGKGRSNALKKKKKKNQQAKKISPSKSRKSFLLNKNMVHQLQNSRGGLVLKLTTEQPRQACFKANYKRKKTGGDGGFIVSLQQQPSPCA